MLSKVKIHRGYIHIYYHKLTTCRISTGIKINKKHFSESKLILKSSGQLDYKDLNKSIVATKKTVDRIILESYDKSILPTGKEVKELFYQKTLPKEVPYKHSPFVLENYADFFTFKSNSRVARESLKQYKSLRNALIDFEKENDIQLKLHHIHTDWLQQFEIFLSTSRKPDSLTQGNLNDNTIKKRFKCFREFWKYMIDRDITKPNNHLINYKIEGYNVDAIALSTEELKAIINYQPRTISQQKAKDMFIFGCMTGMRFSDITTLSKVHVTDDFKVRKGAIKTKDYFEVYLNETAQEILIRNNYNMKLLSNQKINKYIKEVTEQIKLLHKPVQLESRHRGEVIIEEVPKWQVISSHTARRTFTDLLAENHTSLQKIMAMTGHKSVGVVNRYLQKRNKVSLADVTKIDIK